MTDQPTHPDRLMQDAAPEPRFRLPRSRWSHFLVAAGAAFPRFLFAALWLKLGAAEGTIVAVDFLLYALIGLGVGMLWCESVHDVLVGWCGYSAGQVTASMIFGAPRLLYAYVLVSASMSLVPAIAELVGWAGRKLAQKRAG